MGTCTSIKKILKLVFIRGVVFPIGVLMSPLTFLLSEGSCTDGKKEVKEFLAFIWKEAKR